MSQKEENLIHRISRIQGQLEAIKKGINSDGFSKEDCKKNLTLLKASINGLKKFGAAYVAQNLEKCLASKNSDQERKEFIYEASQIGFNF